MFASVGCVLLKHYSNVGFCLVKAHQLSCSSGMFLPALVKC